jgi:hypothetical protein
LQVPNVLYNYLNSKYYYHRGTEFTEESLQLIYINCIVEHDFRWSAAQKTTNRFKYKTRKFR